MGLVVIVIQNPNISTSGLTEDINNNISYGLERLEEDNTKVFIVPDDEEYPDLG